MPKKVAKKSAVKSVGSVGVRASQGHSDKEKLSYLTRVLKKWKHTVFYDGKHAYIAHHIDKKDLKIFNQKHIHKIQLKK